MDKRVFMTVLVCVGIMIVWNTFIMPPQKPKPRPQPASQAAAAVVAPAEVAQVASAPASAPVFEEKSIDFRTQSYTAKLSTLGASITSFTLSGYREAVPDKAEKQPVNLIHQGAGTRAISVELNEQPFPFATVEQRASDVVFNGDTGGLKAQATWHVSKEEDYSLSLDLKFENTTGAPIQIKPQVAVRGVFNERTVKDKSFLAPPPDLLTPVMVVDESLKKHTQGKKDTPEFTQSVGWGGVDRQYFLLAVAPKQGSAGAEFIETRVKGSNDLLELGTVLRGNSISLDPGKSAELKYLVFAGPKVAKLLKDPGVGFESSVDYTVLGMPLGFLSRPMLWVLNRAHDVVGNYGWAIAILTLIVKLLMLPITQKSFVSMQVMKEMKPELDKIKERFPNDREKQGMETMRLYKERGVNPFLSGCLPALLQMPVYFALWRTLWAAVELYQQEFLWFKDLTQPDPYFIVPALLGVTMFFQQKLSPPAGDPQQQKIMLYLMPPLMTSFMLFLPSGLVFYIFINTILTILQQTYISKKFAKKPTLSAA